MDKFYIGYQGELAVRVESSREAIENDKFLVCDRIVEHEGRAELVNGKVLFDTDIDVARAAETVASAKAERAVAVAALTVEVDGLTFDGDEKAQERMARAVLMAESPEESMEWVLADSSVAVVTAEQLRRACRAAGKAMGVLWVKPYQTNTASNTARAVYSVS